MRRSHAGGFGRPLTGLGQSVAYTGTAGTISNAVAAQTYHVYVWATTDCHIRFAGTPTATTADFILKANDPQIFRINPGEKVSAVQVATGGTIYVSEIEL